MSAVAGLLSEMFENRSNFMAPDSGPHKLPYACSFHWFWMPQGDLIGLDVVRSDDMDRRALRVFAISPGREIASLILEGPSSAWAPFATDAPPALDQGKPVLGASLIGDKSLAYGYGSGGIPGFFMTLGRLGKGMIPLGHDSRLELSNIKSFPHVLLDRPTTTATADATYMAGGTGIPVGQVILDFRGEQYAPLLAP